VEAAGLSSCKHLKGYRFISGNTKKRWLGSHHPLLLLVCCTQFAVPEAFLPSFLRLRIKLHQTLVVQGCCIQLGVRVVWSLQRAPTSCYLYARAHFVCASSVRVLVGLLHPTRDVCGVARDMPSPASCLACASMGHMRACWAHGAKGRMHTCWAHGAQGAHVDMLGTWGKGAHAHMLGTCWAQGAHVDMLGLRAQAMSAGVRR